MADSTLNIDIPVNQWVDLYQMSGISVGQEIIVTNIADCDIFLAVQALEPGIGHDAYVILKRNGPPHRNALGSEGAWAYCNVCNARVSVRKAAPINGFFIDNVPNDYFVQVARNNVPGHALRAIQAKEDNSDTVYADVWGYSGNLVYPTAAETWEILSDDPNDAVGGTGARTGVIISLDEDYNEQVVPFSLNGTTPVTLASTHFRPQSNGVVVLTAGTSGSNIGTITVRREGDGLVRSVILPDDTISYDTHFTIPVGKTAYVLQTFNVFEKNFEGSARLRTKDSTIPDASWTGTVPVALYQNLVSFNVQAKLPIPEKTDIKGQLISKNSGGRVSIIVELLLVDL